MADSYEGLLDLVEEGIKAWEKRFGRPATDRLTIEFVLADILIGIQESIGEVGLELHELVELLKRRGAVATPTGTVPGGKIEVLCPAAGDDGS